MILTADDQLCQKMGWALAKIFATSTNLNADASNSETNIGVMDNFVTSCFSTYKDVIKRASFNEEMVRFYLFFLLIALQVNQVLQEHPLIPSVIVSALPIIGCSVNISSQQSHPY